MAVYFNPIKANQTKSGGDTLNIEGNPVANHGTSSPYLVPEGANYVSVWKDADFTVSATPLKDTEGGFTAIYPANTIVQVPNVIGGKTIITVS